MSERWDAAVRPDQGPGSIPQVEVSLGFFVCLRAVGKSCAGFSEML